MLGMKEFSPFTDDFIFSLVMRDTEICKGLLERIISDVEFGEIRLTACEHPLFSDGPLTARAAEKSQIGYGCQGRTL